MVVFAAVEQQGLEFADPLAGDGGGVDVLGFGAVSEG